MKHDVPESIWYCIYCDGISVIQERCHDVLQCEGQGIEERYYNREFVSNAECSMYMQGVKDMEEAIKEKLRPVQTEEERDE